MIARIIDVSSPFIRIFSPLGIDVILLSWRWRLFLKRSRRLQTKFISSYSTEEFISSAIQEILLSMSHICGQTAESTVRSFCLCACVPHFYIHVHTYVHICTLWRSCGKLVWVSISPNHGINEYLRLCYELILGSKPLYWLSRVVCGWRGPPEHPVASTSLPRSLESDICARKAGRASFSAMWPNTNGSPRSLAAIRDPKCSALFLDAVFAACLLTYLPNAF